MSDKGRANGSRASKLGSGQASVCRGAAGAQNSLSKNLASVRHQPNPVAAAVAPAKIRTVQPKAASNRPPAMARIPRSSGGVVQANLIGGTTALQTRLVLRRAPFTPFSGRKGKEAEETIQPKSRGKTQAFKVSLRQRSGGMPIPGDVRSKMETAFGADFSDVRVHVGPEASSIGAIAYTWGTNIHFAPGHYNPHTLQGQKLLGHELWHVLQQKSGRVNNPFGSGVAIVQDDALEAEADRMGVKAALSPTPVKAGSAQ